MIGYPPGSIKGDVKNKHFSQSDRRGVVRHRALCGICRLLVRALAETAKVPILVLSFRGHTSRLDGWQPWFYLRLKGLWLCWVVRGGIWCPVRLSAKAHSLTRLGYSPSNPEHSENDEPIERVPNRSQRLCAQAACGFSCSGSKRSPFFQTIKLMAAILRARVSLAISGFIPFPSRFS